MFGEMHPNQQAKMANLINGLEQRIARLEQANKDMAATVTATEDAVRKMERRLADVLDTVKPAKDAAVIVAPATNDQPEVIPHPTPEQMGVVAEGKKVTKKAAKPAVEKPNA